MDIVIIGAGASGLMAALNIKETNNVTIIEKNDKNLKKLLLTGNGKCNYFNSTINCNNYITENKEILKPIIEENKDKILEIFNQIGIIPKIKNNYYYPYSENSQSIKQALLIEAELKGIKIKNSTIVENIEKKDNKFIITTNKEKITADKVIISTGSKAYPKTGSDGKGYEILKNLGHQISPILPSLCPLIVKNNPLKQANKVRCDVKLKLLEDNKLIKEEIGQLQITENGISGICVFNLSGFVSKGLNIGKKEIIKINFLPFLNSVEDTITFLNKRFDKVTGRTIEQSLESIIDYRIVKIILSKININPYKYPDELTKKEIHSLATLLYNFPLEIIKTEDFNHAQVCLGGILLTEINPKTMESKKVKNLYITGELLDVAGLCGGYNLAFAWISGYLAGKDAGK